MAKAQRQKEDEGKYQAQTPPPSGCVAARELFNLVRQSWKKKTERKKGERKPTLQSNPLRNEPKKEETALSEWLQKKTEKAGGQKKPKDGVQGGPKKGEIGKKERGWWFCFFGWVFEGQTSKDLT